MSSLPTSCWVDTPAKINLTLEILGRRPDGFHELRSLLVPVDVMDRVELQDSDEDSLEVVADGVDLGALGPPQRNLTLRAAACLREVCGVRRHAAIRLTKRIPIGGGLGGGSADAAGMLVGLNRTWGLGLARHELMEIGAMLGSDVPALVHGGAVCMEGRGERISAVCEASDGAVPGFTVVLANPGVAVLTAEVFQACSGVLTCKANTYNNMRSSVRGGDVKAAAAGLFNGLESGVYARYPAIGQLATCLREAGAPGVLLSGSGASVFALAESFGQGECMRKMLPPVCWSTVTTTLPDGVMVAHGPLEP